ncbi:tripartite tricarboxylate transporter substrate binding protein [Pigmentiphaga soli]|uniref:Tripartite tricarboxylate transporter substrate binding protein n=1 Tax=Pigmentiphaga soli TaxID=1007095 RepID=A0ABP8H4P2_9BURK
MRKPAQLLTCLLATFAACGASAETWPQRPVRVLVGFAPGGTTDIIARKLAVPLAQALGKPVVVENRAGASGMIASGELARAEPDGYTIGMIISSNVSVPAIGRKLNFDPIASFQAVALVGQVPMVFAVSPAVPVANLAEFVQLAKKRPGQLFFSSPGIGLAHHFAGELFKLQAGVDIVHVPYSGAAPALADVVAGQVATSFVAVPTVAGSLESGAVKALGLTGSRRTPRLPQLPTIAESGYPDYEITEWYGLAAPAGTPSAVVGRLNAEINRILDTPEWKQWLRENAVLTPDGRTPADFQKFIENEAAKFRRIAHDAHISEAN